MAIGTLADRLKEARQKANPKLRQVDVAKRLGINVVQVSEWETGKYAPNSANLHRLATLYRVSTEWLLTGKTLIQEVMENPVPRGTGRVSEPAAGTSYAAPLIAKELAAKLEAFKREMLRAEADDAEIDFIEETFRRPETARLAHHDSDGKELSPKQVEEQYDALIDGVRHIITRRIERRRKASKAK